MSLFKRPAWAKTKLDTDEGEGKPEKNLFSHSHSYQDIVAESEKRRREKAERKKAKSERRASAKREVEEVKDEPIQEGTPKRRRINSAEREKLLRSVGLPGTLEANNVDDTPAADTPARRSPRKNKRESSGEAGRAHRPAQVIDLGGSSSEDNNDGVQTSAGAAQPRPPAPVEEPEEESDDEFAQLARKARERREQRAGRSSRTPTAGGVSPSPGVSSRHNDEPPEPVIQLLITSDLPNTNPLIVQRKLGQSTGPIREAWCQKQGFPREFMNKVFFIHNMRRVYDVTTCRSLGLEVDQYGNLFMRGAEGREGVEKVNLVAVTDDMFAEMQKEKARAALGGAEAAGDENDTEEPPAAPEQDENSIRVYLRAKGRPDIRLKVKDSTDMEQLAAAYVHKSFGPDSEQRVRLEFDGEQLSPSAVVGDIDISDLEIIEVHMVS